MPSIIHPKYPKDLDLSKPLPHANYEAFCRAVARAESMTDAYRQFIEAEADVNRARRCGPKLWTKWWIRGRVEVIAEQLQQVASATSLLVKDDVLQPVCKKFRELEAREPKDLKEFEYQVRGLCQLGEMINKLTGSYTQKAQKNEIKIKVRKDAVREDEA